MARSFALGSAALTAGLGETANLYTEDRRPNHVKFYELRCSEFAKQMLYSSRARVSAAKIATGAAKIALREAIELPALKLATSTFYYMPKAKKTRAKSSLLFVNGLKKRTHRI